MPLPLLIPAAVAIVRAGGIAAATYGVAKAVHDYKQHNNGERFLTDMTAALEPGLYGPFSAMSDIRDSILGLDPESLIKLSEDLGKFLRPLDDLMKGLGEKLGNAEKIPSPIILDLDGDGVETVALSRGIWFDHAGDGFAEQTGWAGKDDGLLVRDLDGNGLIDSGAELFGSETQLTNGSKAANGFEALTELDANLDGKIDSTDAAFTTLRIWKDTDGDGHTDDGELITLEEAGVQSINVGYTDSATVDANGNAHKQIGSYITAEGQTQGATDVWFQTDATYSIATDWVEVPEEIALLPDATGYGKVRDLHQAMALDATGELKALVTAFTQATTPEDRGALVTQIIYHWTGVQDVDPASRAARMIYGNAIGDARKLEALEEFMGEEWVGVWCWGTRDPNPHGRAAPVLLQAYSELTEMVYGRLMVQSHLKPLYDKISFVWNEAEGRMIGDLSGVAAEITTAINTDRIVGKDLLGEFMRTLKGMGVLGILDLVGFQGALAPLGADVELIVIRDWVIAGTEGNDYLKGGNDADALYGMGGNDTIEGNGGADVLIGGAGNDRLFGGEGVDQYRFERGDGQDTIQEDYREDSWILIGDRTFDELVFRRLGNHMVMSFGTSPSDQILLGDFYVRADANSRLILRKGDGETRILDTATLTLLALTGTEDADILNGGPLADIIVALGGNDLVFAGDGNNNVDAGVGNDEVYGGDGDDTLTGGEGDDRLYGYNGANTLNGGEGNDSLYGGAENDNLAGGAGDDLLDGGPGDDLLQGGDENDVLYGGAGADSLFGNDGDDLLDAGAGNDTLEAATGNDTLYGRDGNDSLMGGDGDDLLYGNEGNDTLQGEDGDDTLDGAIGNDVLHGGAGKDKLYGRVDNDVLLGNEGDDLLYGNEGNDVLQGGNGTDILHGGDGEDVLDGGTGADLLYGGNGTWRGTGNDTYVFGHGYGHDTVFDYDSTPGNVDIVRLNADVALGNVQLKRVGADLILALAGTEDSLTIKNWFSEAAEGVLLTQYRVERIEFADGTVWDTTEILRRSLIGTDVNDTLRGYITDDVLAGNAGHDSLLGRAGNDDLNGGTGDDVLDGGAGNDTYRFGRGYGRDVAVEQASWTTQGNRVVLNADVMPVDVVVRKVGNDLTLAIKGTTDMLTLRDAAVYAEGSAFGSVEFSDGTTWNYEALKGLAIAGTDGNDRIEGFDGPAEVFDGGAGNDVIEGGTGADTYMFGRGDGQDVIMDWDWNSGNIDTLEFKVGVLPSDVLLTREGQDLVARIADTGDQTTIKGWFDPYSYTVIERIRFADGTSWDVTTVLALVGVTPGEAYLFGTPGPDMLTGGAANNFIFGQEGDDLLSGGDGNDTLEGGDGNDMLLGGDGMDTLNGGLGLDHLNSGAGDDTLHAGGDLGNTYVIEQGGGFDTIKVAPVWSGVGEDVLRFGPGITLANLKVQITEFNDGGYGGGEDGGYGGVAAFAFIGEDGIDRGPIFSNRLALAIGTGTNEGALLEMYGDGGIYTPIDFGVRRFVFDDGTELSLDDILALADGGVIGEQFGTAGDDSWLLGSVANDTVLGLGGNDRIETRDNEDAVFGNDGDDAISAGSGDDEVYGDDGDDVIAGGQGNDIVDGGNGTDVYVFNRGDGEDRLGAADDDTISFGVGILPEDIFVYRNLDGDLVLRLNDGMDGTLTVYGGLPKAGDEVSHLPIQRVQFIDADGHTRIFDFASALISHTARLNVSDGINPVQLLAAPGFEITGLETVAGGDYAVAYAQTGNLFGTPFYATPVVPGMGNDFLTGTTGQDTLDAGDGNDVVNAGAGDDVVLGGGGNDLLEGASGNDILNGGSGDDRLFGGSGNDILQGGGGNDLASGGAGDDTYVFNMGDGELTIMEAANWSGENRLRFGPGVSSEALKLSHDAGYLVIHSDTPGDVIRVEGFDRQDALGERAVAWFEFADGTVLSYDDLLARGFDIEGTPVEDLLQGTNLADRITGYDGADILEGGWGADVLAGGAGADEYIFNLGDGADVLVDGNEVHEATTLKFGAGVVPGSIYLTHENGSYVLRYGDGGDSIRFAGDNVSAPFSLLTFADGTSLDFAALTTVGMDITGTINPDSLVGTAGADRINGLASDDTLSGGDGFDIYTVAADGGFDTIIDQVNLGEENLVVFSGPAFTLDQLRLVSIGQPGLLTLEVAGETRGVRLSGFDPANALTAGAVGFFQLGDGGPVHSYAELAALGFNVVGTAEDDVLQGTAVFDRISGGAGNDHLQGGPGNDVAEGGAGDDHYYYNMGDGLLSIRDEISLAAENTLHFGPGITLDNIRNNLRFEAPEGGSQGALIINVDADGNGIRIEGFNPDDAATGVHAVEYYVFADGTVLSYAELVSNTFVVQGDGADNVLTGTNIVDRLYGYGGNDTLIGNAGSDTLTGGPGADILQGGVGDDAYVFNRGDGVDTIFDSGTEDFNYIQFGAGILPGDVAYEWDGSTLVLNYGVGDAVRITDFYAMGDSGNPAVLAMAFDNGTVLSLTELMNRAPVSGVEILAPDALEDNEYQFIVPVDAYSDPDVGDQLSYQARMTDGSPLPSWLTFNPSTRAFRGTPGNDDVGILDITLEAKDHFGLSVSQTFSLEVINVNDAPLVANPIPPQTLLEDTSFSYTVPNDVFVDVDTGDSLTYSAILTDGTPLPAWLAFDAGTRTLSGTPGNAEVGSLAISITATDLSGTSASTILALNIANTNDAPVVINPIPAQTLLEDEAFTYTVPDNVFADIDIDDSLAYSATLTDGSALPSWLSFDPATRTFTGLPANGDVGSLAISVTATDLAGASVATAFDLSVLNVNDAPILGGTPIPALTLLEDEAFSYTLPENTFLDVDAGDSLSYSATLTDGSALPSWLSFDATTRTFSGLPANGDVGSLAISVTATDLAGASVATAFDLSVLNVNDAPVVSTPIVDQSAKQGQAYLYTLPANSFTDPDVGDSLSYEVSLENGDPLPAWLSFDATTRTFSGTPGGGDVGNFGVKVTASDRAGARVADSFTFSVSPGYNEINGTAGWDFLIGTAGNDRIDGKASADFMAGLGGDDLYIVDSWDFVLEFAGGGVDTVEASVSYQLPWHVENLSLTGSGAVNGTGNFMNNVLIGNSAANTLTGLGGDDILIGGKGNDRLIGGTGNDLYLFGRGDGADTIVDYDRTSGNSDTLRFGADISAEQLWFSRTGNDLSVSVIGSQDTVSISNWYLGTANHVERIEAGNGQVVLDSQVQNLVNAMAAFAPPAAGQTSLPTDYQASLAPVIAANWQ